MRLTVCVAECGSAKELYRAAEDAHFYNSVPYFDLTQPSNQRNISGNHSPWLVVIIRVHQY